MDASAELLERHFGESLSSLGIAGLPEAVVAAGSLLQLLLFNGIFRIAGTVVLGLLCFSLSALFEKTLPVMVFTALSVLSAPLLHVFNVTVMDDLMLNGLLGGTAPLLSGAGALAAVLWSGAAVLLSVLSFYKMEGA